MDLTITIKSEKVYAQESDELEDLESVGTVSTISAYDEFHGEGRNKYQIQQQLENEILRRALMEEQGTIISPEEAMPGERKGASIEPQLRTLIDHSKYQGNLLLQFKDKRKPLYSVGSPVSQSSSGSISRTENKPKNRWNCRYQQEMHTRCQSIVFGQLLRPRLSKLITQSEIDNQESRFSQQQIYSEHPRVVQNHIYNQQPKIVNSPIYNPQARVVQRNIWNKQPMVVQRNICNQTPMVVQQYSCCSQQPRVAPRRVCIQQPLAVRPLMSSWQPQVTQRLTCNQRPQVAQRKPHFAHRVTCNQQPQVAQRKMYNRQPQVAQRQINEVPLRLNAQQGMSEYVDSQRQTYIQLPLNRQRSKFDLQHIDAQQGISEYVDSQRQTYIQLPLNCQRSKFDLQHIDAQQGISEYVDSQRQSYIQAPLNRQQSEFELQHRIDGVHEFKGNVDIQRSKYFKPRMENQRLNCQYLKELRLRPEPLTVGHRGVASRAAIEQQSKFNQHSTNAQQQANDSHLRLERLRALRKYLASHGQKYIRPQMNNPPKTIAQHIRDTHIKLFGE